MKTCLIIPVYNNPATICKVVLDCLSLVNLNILVIDDGSSPPVSKLFQDSKMFSQVSHARLQVISHSNNLGKGAAIKTGISIARELGYSHVLTMDGDGQHYADDLSKLLDCSRENPKKLIIGAREMNAKNSPWLSRFGRFISNAWVITSTAQSPGDSQSGMRLYPLDGLENLNLHKQKYDFEMEVLLKLLQSGTKCISVNIKVIYPPKRLRISHFRLFADNLKIAVLCLETLLERWANSSRILLSFLVRG